MHLGRYHASGYTPESFVLEGTMQKRDLGSIMTKDPS